MLIYFAGGLPREKKKGFELCQDPEKAKQHIKKYGHHNVTRRYSDDEILRPPTRHLGLGYRIGKSEKIVRLPVPIEEDIFDKQSNHSTTASQPTTRQNSTIWSPVTSKASSISEDTHSLLSTSPKEIIGSITAMLIRGSK
jgi:hypothetical protein